MSAPRRFSFETLALIGMGAVFFGAGAFMCVYAYRAGTASTAGAPPAIAEVSPALPPAQFSLSDEAPPAPEVFAPAPAPTSIFGPPPSDLPLEPAPRPVRPLRPALLEKPTSPSIALGPSTPLPPSRPIELNPARPTPSPTGDVAALPPMPRTLSQYDRFTAVYDLTAHTVYLPDGGRLEAHSGLGSLRDDPAHVDEKDRGATPPHMYDLTLREDLFHGVQALRLNPVGGPSAIFGRAGLLAHTYMLGPNGDSNGCVSFKNYDAFLQAFQNGLIKRLAVVPSLHSMMLARRQ
jgi:hypothetical protein